jgi:hypothetical protein
VRDEGRLSQRSVFIAQISDFEVEGVLPLEFPVELGRDGLGERFEGFLEGS